MESPNQSQRSASQVHSTMHASVPFRSIFLAFVFGVCLSCPSEAGFVFSGSGVGQDSGNPLGASADFEFDSGELRVTLTNTSPFDYLASPNSSWALPTDVLTGLFFDYDGGWGPSLVFDSATAPLITVGTNPTNLKLSATPGGWDFAQSALSGVTQHYGVGTAGFGIFSGKTSSKGPGHPSNYGVMNSLYVAGENNPGIGTGTPYANNSITFVFSTPSFDVTKVGNVRFQYGTDLCEGSFEGTLELRGPVPTPEPASAVLLLLGSLAGAGVRKRFGRSKNVV